jgi:hypothetical protein
MTLNDSVLVQNYNSIEQIRLDSGGGTPFIRLGQTNGGGASQSEVVNYTITQRNQSYTTGYIWEGKLTAEADAGFHIRSWDITTSTLHPLLLECSQLLLNGIPLSTINPPKAQAYGGAGWSISAGSWSAVSTGNQIIFPSGSGWNGYKSFQVSFNFNCYTSHENTGILYIVLSDTNGAQSVCYSTGNPSYPCYNTGGSSFAGSFTQFDFSSTIQLNNTTGLETFYLDIYLGHNGGSWSGSALWAINLLAIN